jgi:Fur family ferric uptake transcriptional regulator
MIDHISPLHSVLQAHNKRVTSARISVYEALQGKEPLTMKELVALCEQRTDRASVYRTVELFEELAVVQRLQIGWKYKLELGHNFSYHHHHCTCQQCGRIIPLSENEQLELGLQQLADELHFKMLDHQVEIRGACADCQTIIV